MSGSLDILILVVAWGGFLLYLHFCYPKLDEFREFEDAASRLQELRRRAREPIGRPESREILAISEGARRS